MDYEQKYKNLVAKVKNAYLYAQTDSTKAVLESIFSELAESEDERIRKVLIDAIPRSGEMVSILKNSGVYYQDAIAWLEKQKEQKEQKLITFNEPYNSDEYEVVEIGNATCLRRKEQKPVEQIEDNEEESIGTILINALNGNARLEWELKRAGVNVQKLITYLKQNPAKWNEEDRAKIGTLSSIIFDYAFHKDALDENNDLTGEYAELENWLESLPERFELPSKQEWNENDEAAFGDLMWCIEQARKSAKDENDMGNIWFAENWVKTRLKFLRTQSKQEWSEEDEQTINTIINHFKVDLECTDEDDIIVWLKDLQYRLKPLRTEQEWSEEDRKMLEVISYKISQHQGNDERSLFTPDESEFISEMEDKLKSLHSSWKPNEEQMRAVVCAIEECGYNSGLESLYDDLKKL